MTNKIYNTGETEESLRSEYNPEGSNLRKVQQRMLDMLLYLDEISKKLGIEYRIDGGTVLGAVRHGGFIPWDDDIDIGFERKDWLKICNYLKSHPHPQYVLQDHESDPGFYQSWAKLRDTKSEYIQMENFYKCCKYKGVQVDLFSFEKGNWTLFMYIAWYISRFNKFFFVGRCKPIADFNHYILYKIICPCMRLINNLHRNKDYYRHSFGTMWMLKFPTRVVTPHKDIFFEGHTVSGPCDPEGLCRLIYGGERYKELPAKNKRVVHANDVVIID